MDIHGKQKQQKRTTTFFQFCKADKVHLAFFFASSKIYANALWHLFWQFLAHATSFSCIKLTFSVTEPALSFTFHFISLLLSLSFSLRLSLPLSISLCTNTHIPTTLEYRAFCSVLMSPHVDWTYRRWTGSCSTTPQTTPRSTSTVWAVQREGQAGKVHPDADAFLLFYCLSV